MSDKEGRSSRNFLFVCSQNKLRSPTAEQIFADEQGVNTLSAGTNRDAESPLTEELVEWADIIFVMERQHRNKLQKKFRKALKDQSVVVLSIPDDYEYMDPDLIDILKAKMRRWLPMATP